MDNKNIINKNYFDNLKKINGIDYILWINLDRSVERRNYMENLLKPIPIPNERIEAIDGNQNFNFIENIKIPQKLLKITISNKEICCTLSHIKAINYLKNVKGKYFMICEDDISFNNLRFLNSDLKKIIEDSPLFDILQISVVKEYFWKQYKNKKNYAKWDTYLSAVSYIVSKKGVNNFIKRAQYINDYKYILNEKYFKNIISFEADWFIYPCVNTITYKYSLITTLNKNTTLNHSVISVNFYKNIQTYLIVNDLLMNNIKIKKINKSCKNIFIYKYNKNDYYLIKILHNLIYLHSKNGIGYNVYFINDKNVKKYIKIFPQCYNKLSINHKIEYIKTNIICDYGGIWLDNDILVLDSLDSLFDIFKNNDGFFIKDNNNLISNRVFGSKKNTKIMKSWKKYIYNKFLIKDLNIDINYLQNKYINDLSLYKEYIIFNGLENMCPINYNNCIKEFIDKKYNNYKKIIRPYQPLLFLFNSVSIKIEELIIIYKEDINKSSYQDKIFKIMHKFIFKDTIPLSYFLNKSYNNFK